jgi:hypothetical protein
MTAARRVVLLGLLVAAALTGFPSGAQAQSEGDASELWETFPLAPAPSQEAANAAATPTPTPAPVRIIEEGGVNTLTLICLMVFAAGLGALALSLVRGRRRASRAPSVAPARGAPAAGDRASRGPAPSRAVAAARAAPPANGRPATATVRRNGLSPRAPAPRRFGPVLPRSAAPRPLWAEPVAADRPPPAPATEAGGSAVCTIDLWHGYVRKQFYAAVPGDGSWIAESPFFRVGPDQPVAESEAARDALRALVADLEARGWEVAGRGEMPWELELRRTAGAGVRPEPQPQPS